MDEDLRAVHEFASPTGTGHPHRRLLHDQKGQRQRQEDFVDGHPVFPLSQIRHGKSPRLARPRRRRRVPKRPRSSPVRLSANPFGQVYSNPQAKERCPLRWGRNLHQQRHPRLSHPRHRPLFQLGRFEPSVPRSSLFSAIFSPGS